MMGGPFASSFEPALFDLGKRAQTLRAKGEEAKARALEEQKRALMEQLLAGCPRLTCDNCGNSGHESKDCPRPKRK